MTRSPLDDLVAPLIDVAKLGRRAIRLRIARMQADLAARAASVAVALGLAVLALVLLIVVLALLVQAGLLWLAALGLTPVQALLTVSLACLVLALILIAVARSCLRRALRPLPLPPAAGTDISARRP